MEVLQVWLGFLSPVVVALLGLLQANWRKADKADAERWREKLAADDAERKSEADAVASGVRSLLRSSIIRAHHECVGKGWASIAEREALEKNYEAYRGLHGNGVAASLHDEVMQLPTKDKE